MAKATIKGNIPSIGEIEVTGNLATEDAINDLIDAVNKKTSADRLSTRDIQDNLDDASDSVDEFSDELDSAVRSQSKLSKKMIELARSTAESSASFIKTTGKTDSMSDMIESAGEVVSGFIGGVSNMIPGVGKIIGKATQAVAQAGFALLSMAVGAIESFQEMNRTIMQGGLILQGGFSGLANAADIAGIPVTEFGNAIMANISRLRLLEGGAPGGLARISNGFKALQEAQDENLDTLYALGFSQQQVVSGMADVALGAQRAGRNLSDEELAAGTFDYLRNLQELSRLTGESAEAIQAQVEANRSNLFVQNALLDVAPQYRDAAAQFTAAIPAALGPMRDFIVTGQSFSTESGMMVSQMSTFANLYRSAYEAVASGQLSEEQARDRFARSLEENRTQINAELESMQRTFGIAPDQAYADMLGALGFTVDQMTRAGAAFDAISDLDGNNLSVTMGALQGAGEAARAAIQSTFIEGLDELSGDDGLMTRFAESISGAAMGVENFRDSMLAIMKGDYEAAAEILGIDTGRAARESLAQAGEIAQTEIPEGLDPGAADIIQQMQKDLVQLRANELMSVEGRRNPMVDLLEEKLDQQRQQLIDLLGPESARGLLQSMRLPEAASGNILSGPDTGYGAYLHGTEAVVPLPDGRTIPVSMNTGGLSSAIVDALIAENSAADNNNPTAQSFAASLDSSRSLPELVNISRNMLNQMVASTQKLEQMIRAMEQGNSISRNAAYARA